MSVRFTRQQYIDFVKDMVTGSRIKLEIDDEAIGKYVDYALITIQRYIDQPTLVTVPFARCIDLKDFNYDSIVNVYRTRGFTGDITSGLSTSQVDPMYAQQWSAFTTGGTTYSLSNYIYNYMSYNTLLQLRNQMGADLDFKEDKTNEKLYIYVNYDIPSAITIEYIPITKSVEDINSSYWIDILRRMALALVKIALGRIRTRFSQNNGVWGQDGDKMLEEGNTEYNALIQRLENSGTYFYPLD